MSGGLSGFFGSLKRVFQSSSAHQQLEETGPETGIAGPADGNPSSGREKAEAVKARWMAVVAADPYTKMLGNLGRALGAFEKVPDSRLGTAAAKPIKAFADTLPALFGALNAAGGALQAALNDRGTAEKALTAAAAKVEARFTALDDQGGKLAKAVLDGVNVLKKSVDDAKKANIGKNYSNLHGQTVMLFEAAEQVNKVFSIVVGVVATGVGHPHAGVAVKAALSGVISGVAAVTKTIQTTLDGKDEGIMDQAESLLGHDAEDVMTVANIKAIASAAKTAAGKLPGLLHPFGISVPAIGDPAILKEVATLADEFTTAYHTAVTGVFDDMAAVAKEAAKPAASGDLLSELDDQIDKSAAKGASAANKKLDELKAKLQTKLRGKAEAIVQGALKSLEDRIRGARSEETLDIAGLTAELTEVAAEAGAGGDAGTFPMHAEEPAAAS